MAACVRGYREVFDRKRYSIESAIVSLEAIAGCSRGIDYLVGGEKKTDNPAANVVPAPFSSRVAILRAIEPNTLSDRPFSIPYSHVAIIAAAWTGVWFGASALLSGFVSRPVQAVLGALVIVGLLQLATFSALRTVLWPYELLPTLEMGGLMATNFREPVPAIPPAGAQEA